MAGLPPYVLVRDSEEKGSDVNLATRLLVDGFNGGYEQAVVVSNDADFAGAMRYVRDILGLRVTLVNPDPWNSSPRELADAATYVKRLWKSHLRRSPPSRHTGGRDRDHPKAARLVTFGSTNGNLKTVMRRRRVSLPQIELSSPPIHELHQY